MKISKRLIIQTPVGKAYEKFVHELNNWWPKEYTWSQEDLEKIFINPQVNGLCTELGPDGFRCDWGRVTELKDNETIRMKWQISPKREPIPNPAKASDIMVSFTKSEDSTTVYFEHYNFENHGEDAKSYQEMMDSEYGWSYILEKYKTYCEK